MVKDKKYNILYLDDEESNLRIFRAAFKHHYKIFTAKSGLEGIDILKNEEIHLIITDQRMPKMTGVEFLERIIPEYPDPIRIIITGFADIEDIVRALNKCGIHRYIVKPWNREELKLTIDKALETFQLKKDNSNLLGELKEINNNLEGKIQERTSELMETNSLLHEAKEKAEEASLAKEHFLSTMSHEIRTPLNAIIGVSHLLKQSSLNPEQQDNVQILEFSANNLLSLINDILDMSKIEAGKIDLESVDFDLFNLLSGVYKTMLVKAEDKGLNLELELDDNLPVSIVGDQVRLGQILLNLTNNAIKFTENGTVSIIISVLEESQEKVKINFEVRDTGIGIAPEMIDKIFEDFSQASSDTTRKYGGTGLGLSITKKLIELQESQIKVESEQGLGSTFSFPIWFVKGSIFSDDTPADIQPYVVGDKNLQGMTVLVVEDNKFNQVIARKFLSSWNANVEFANNGKIALDKLKESRAYKLILMDIQMPEMDGYEATRSIRAWPQPYYKEIPIIALSASTLLGEKDKAISAGMDDYVMKPFNPESLYSKIVSLTNSQKELINKSSNNDSNIENSKQEGLHFDRFKRMVENDDTFYAELLSLTIEDYEEFKLDFIEALKTIDLKKMSEICHKIRPSMIVLGLEWLDKEILEFRNNIKDENYSKEYLQDKKLYYEEEFSRVIKDLQKEQTSIKK